MQLHQLDPNVTIDKPQNITIPVDLCIEISNHTCKIWKSRRSDRSIEIAILGEVTSAGSTPVIVLVDFRVKWQNKMFVTCVVAEQGIITNVATMSGTVETKVGGSGAKNEEITTTTGIREKSERRATMILVVVN